MKCWVLDSDRSYSASCIPPCTYRTDDGCLSLERAEDRDGWGASGNMKNGPRELVREGKRRSRPLDDASEYHARRSPLVLSPGGTQRAVRDNLRSGNIRR